MPRETLISELEIDCEMSEEQARSFLEELTGQSFDAASLYNIRWPSYATGGANWAKYEDLRIHRMDEHETAMWHAKAKREQKTQR